MEYIELDNYNIPLVIKKKKNKNTYFHFKSEGFIQINQSRYQSKRDIIKYIKKNKDLFIGKYLKNCLQHKDPTEHYVWGKKYSVVKSHGDKVVFDNELDIVYEPNIAVDQLKKIYKINEKNIMLKYLEELKTKHMNNGYVDIKNIVIKTRYTKTRHGSCNPKKRTININLHLVNLDKEYTEYVFLHEIAHLNVANHSQNFYDLLHKLSPNYKDIKKRLKQQRLG